MWSRWQTRLTAAIVGASSVFTYAPFHLGSISLGWLAPLPLAWLFYQLVSLRNAAQGSVIRPAASIGWWYGLGAFLAGVYWIAISLSVFGGMPMWMAAIGTALFAAYLALFPMGAAMLSVWLMRPNRWLTGFIFAMSWVMTEWLRGWLFSGFPWLATGFSQADTFLGGLYPIGGVLLASFAVALVAAALVLGIVRREKRWLGVVAGIYVVSFGFGQLSWTTPTGAPLTISLLQGNIPQDLKWNPAFARQSLDTYLAQLKSAKGQLKVLPETALPLMFQRATVEIPDFMAQVRHIAIQPHQAVLMGTPEEGRRWDEYYNSAVLMQAGAENQWYRKSHLVPLGEFLPAKPLSTWLLNVLNIPLGEMSSGAPVQPAIQMGAHRLAVNICYEDVFGAELVKSVPAASVMVNISNLAWFGRSIALDQHLQIARVRAMENARPMIRATNTGATAIIDAQGKLVAALPYFEAGVLEGSVQGMTGLTPYQRIADRWVWGLIVLLMGLAWWRQKPRG